MSDIHPLILCGGSGTRLWPLSRAHQPKQFQPINGEGSLTFFQSTVQRHRSDLFSDPIVCVGSRHVQTVGRQLREIQSKAHIITEPVARNTGPAVLAASLYLAGAKPDAVLVVLPSDHVIKGELNRLIAQMHDAALDGLVVTFGIQPSYAEKGYGYIMDGGRFDHYPGLHRVESFIEKPSTTIAQSLIDTGFAYWASGISMFRASKLISEYQRHDPATFAHVQAALQSASPLEAEAGLLLDERHFMKAENQPTEKAVFERCKDIALAPAAIEWDDVGGWTSLHAIGMKNESGNVTSGDVVLFDTRGSLVRGGERLVAVVGMNDVVVVDTDDALLVTNKASSQDVKRIVEHLVTLKRREAENHRSQVTEWGRIKSMQAGPGFAMDLLSIDSGKTVTLVGEEGVSRTLAVIHGRLQLVGDHTQSELTPGLSAMVAIGKEARLVNTADTPAEVIEISCGNASALGLSGQSLAAIAADVRAADYA
ncbi:NTP transferase domain-containing protein [Rhizobium sp. RHZ02]|uniref:mannose-1-phosphate guanylyltransferase n=1 Tax=Rhizobium sp. RHZ02 TaxID=2769306 RepID=UPI001785F92D|nr:sugar phosphate nucleotidyltransferase [Rhizobium sp. RHZ02]MBD9455350.1 NTP transferase domain-containing protein [Rhizobium sp. RHZ02]